MDLDDAGVMRCVQQGQRELFEVLVRRYRGALLRVAHSRLGNRSWAEDVVQEAFLAAYTARDTYRPEFAFRTWLWTILLHLCHRQWKRQQRRGHSTELLPEDGPASQETGLTVALRTERGERLHLLLDRLPEVQADALRLRFFGGLTFPEIADVMGSSLGAAKMRVKNGLEALSAWLRDEENGDDVR